MLKSVSSKLRLSACCNVGKIFFCVPTLPTLGMIEKGCVMLPFVVLQRRLASASFPSGFYKTTLSLVKRVGGK